MRLSEFKIAAEFSPLGTRENGAKAREEVLRALEAHSRVTLDFTDAHPSPSFADELVGKLAAILGQIAFKQRIFLTGVGPSERSLLQHVVMKRLQDRASAQGSSSVHGACA
jgi:hypothetical protein